MVAEFRGPSPHDLGTAELATARFVDEGVEVSLHLLDDCTGQWVRSFKCG